MTFNVHFDVATGLFACCQSSSGLDLFEKDTQNQTLIFCPADCFLCQTNHSWIANVEQWWSTVWLHVFVPIRLSPGVVEVVFLVGVSGPKRNSVARCPEFQFKKTYDA